MLQKADGLIVFVSAMDPYNEGMMTDVLRVVAAVCLVADGWAQLTFYMYIINSVCLDWHFMHTYMSNVSDC